jgi:hypothetical protein
MIGELQQRRQSMFRTLRYGFLALVCAIPLAIPQTSQAAGTVHGRQGNPCYAYRYNPNQGRPCNVYRYSYHVGHCNYGHGYNHCR